MNFQGWTGLESFRFAPLESSPFSSEASALLSSFSPGVELDEASALASCELDPLEVSGVPDS